MLEELGWIGNLVILIAALAALNRPSNITINHSLKVAGASGLGKTTVGFILVAFTTSLPELFVAIFAIIQPENVGVSIGNVLGSNIANIGSSAGNNLCTYSFKIQRQCQVSPSHGKKGNKQYIFRSFGGFCYSLGFALHRVCKLRYRRYYISKLQFQCVSTVQDEKR